LVLVEMQVAPAQTDQTLFSLQLHQPAEVVVRQVVMVFKVVQAVLEVDRLGHLLPALQRGV
jgi:hypothetical protein